MPDTGACNRSYSARYNCKREGTPSRQDCDEVQLAYNRVGYLATSTSTSLITEEIDLPGNGLTVQGCSKQFSVG
jgi:hypothetical protein